MKSIDQIFCERIIERLKACSELKCNVLSQPYDPASIANEIALSAMGNNGVVLVSAGNADEYQNGAGQTAEPTMWRQFLIVLAIYNNIGLYPKEHISPAFYLRAMGDVVESLIWNWNPFNFAVPATMKPKIKSRALESAFIDDSKQMSVLTLDVRIPINVNIRTKLQNGEAT